MNSFKVEFSRAFWEVVTQRRRALGLTKRQLAERMGPKMSKSQSKAVTRTFLVELRRDSGLTQRQLAAGCKRPPSYIAKMEVGERGLLISDLFILAQGSGLTRNELLGRYNRVMSELEEKAGVSRSRRRRNASSASRPSPASK